MAEDFSFRDFWDTWRPAWFLNRACALETDSHFGVPSGKMSATGEAVSSLHACKTNLALDFLEKIWLWRCQTCWKNGDINHPTAIIAERLVLTSRTASWKMDLRSRWFLDLISTRSHSRRWQNVFGKGTKPENSHFFSQTTQITRLPKTNENPFPSISLFLLLFKVLPEEKFADLSELHHAWLSLFIRSDEERKTSIGFTMICIDFHVFGRFVSNNRTSIMLYYIVVVYDWVFNLSKILVL